MASGVKLNGIEVKGIKFNGAILDIGGGGGSDTPSTEWQPHPDWWDIKTILENDTRDYAYKLIYVLNDASDTISLSNGKAYATSDGAFYTSSVTHTWDRTKDKPCYIDGVEVYKTRYVIFYSNTTINNIVQSNDILYVYFNKGATQNITSLSALFYQRAWLEGVHNLDTSNVNDFSRLFMYCSGLKNVPDIDTSKATLMDSIFYGCSSLRSVPKTLNTTNVTNLNAMFRDCLSLIEIPPIDTSNATNVSSLFSGCSSIVEIPPIDISNATTVKSLCQNCSALKVVPPLDTSKVTDFGSVFSGCKTLERIPEIDLISATSVSSAFGSCSKLRYIGIKNIKITGITFSSSTALYRNCIIDIIKQLWDYSGGETSYKITLGSSNISRVANIYVKLITPTAEQIAEDPYIESKMPCEVCESTDEGAMLILDYASAKGWTIS